MWVRGLIRPGPGTALAYVDYEQQEFGIAAALSGDPAMMDAYRSGDPYLAFARQAGAVPAEATKQTHRDVRLQGAEERIIPAVISHYGSRREGLHGIKPHVEIIVGHGGLP